MRPARREKRLPQRAKVATIAVTSTLLIGQNAPRHRVRPCVNIEEKGSLPRVKYGHLSIRYLQPIWRIENKQSV